MVLGSVIYDALPFIYATGGVTALLLSDNDLGRTSAVLLISAAMLVFHMRLEYRRRLAEATEDTLAASRLDLARVRSYGQSIRAGWNQAGSDGGG